MSWPDVFSPWCFFQNRTSGHSFEALGSESNKTSSIFAFRLFFRHILSIVSKVRIKHVLAFIDNGGHKSRNQFLRNIWFLCFITSLSYFFLHISAKANRTLLWVVKVSLPHTLGIASLTKPFKHNLTLTNAGMPLLHEICTENQCWNWLQLVGRAYWFAKKDSYHNS